MSSIDDVREIARVLPGVVETVGGHTGEPAWRVKSGQIAWIRPPSLSDLRQLAELDRTWPEGPVLGVRVGSLEEKEELLAAEPGWMFTIPHFDGYPAALVRLDEVEPDRLAEIITDAWLLRAPAGVAKEWLARHGLH